MWRKLKQTSPNVDRGSKYRIAWKSKKTGLEGHGEYLFDKQSCEAQCQRLNNHHQDISHWAEKKMVD